MPVRMRLRQLRRVLVLWALFAATGGAIGAAACVGRVVARSGVPARAAGVSWSLTFPLPGGDLSAVSCVSGSACMTVGSDVGPSSLWWNGTRWRPYTSRDPAPNAPNASSLSGVSCTLRSSCIAVGEYDKEGCGSGSLGCNDGSLPFAEEWNGIRWKLQATPKPPGAELGRPRVPESAFTAISCPSADDCFAVGYDNANHPLAEHWNGVRWTVEPTAAVSGLFESVSCITASACAAVGMTSSGGQALAGHWDGRRWSVQAMPAPSELRGVSCASARACIAVGTVGTVALAETWNGSVWTTLTTAAVGAASELNGVSCSSSHACTAVGEWYATAPAEGLAMTLAERWNGAGWIVEPTPSVRNDPEGGSYLNAVSCTARAACIAVGNDQGNDGLVVRRRVRPDFTVTDIRTFVDGTIRLGVSVPAPGRIDILETAWNDNLARAAALLQPAPRRFVFARTHTSTSGTGTITLTAVPGRRGRELVRDHRYRVTLRLWVTYTRDGRRPQTVGFRGVHLPPRVFSG